MKQKLLLLSLLTLLGSITANALQFVVGGIKYETVTSTIAGVISQDGGYTGSIIIPSTVTYNSKTYNVTRISSKAFANCDGLTSIEISYGVKYIGESAFCGCSYLESVVIPNSVTEIGNDAFWGCSNLSAIVIPNSVTKIGSRAFTSTALTSVTIPKSVTCLGLSSTSQFNVFSSCPNLSYITVEDGNSVYDSREGCNAIIISSTNKLLTGSKNTIIPNSVTAIGSRAFYGNKVLTTIDIPNSVTSIEQQAFEGCTGLTSVVIPSSVTNFDNSAFTSCSNLTSIISEMDAPSDTYSYPDFYDISTSCRLTVPYGKRDAYIAAGWTTSIFKGGVVEAPMTVLPQFDLTDATVYENNVRQDYETLTYTRTFNNTNWQALYVPFSMSYDDWKDDFDVGRIVAYYPFYDEDGTLLRADLILAYVKSGSLIPNHPYFIKSKSTGTKTITLTNATLYPSEENSIDCSTVETRCTFTGTYTSVQREGLLVMGGGTLGSLGNATLSPMRWYMVIKGRNNQIVLPPSNIKIRAVDDFEATEILQQLSERQANTIYDLYGRKLEEMPNRKGVYIINGKKVFIR